MFSSGSQSLCFNDQSTSKRVSIQIPYYITTQLNQFVVYAVDIKFLNGSLPIEVRIPDKAWKCIASITAKPSSDSATGGVTIWGKTPIKLVPPGEIQLGEWYRLCIVVKGIDQKSPRTIDVKWQQQDGKVYEKKDVAFHDLSSVASHIGKVSLTSYIPKKNSIETGELLLDNFIQKVMDFSSGSEFVVETELANDETEAKVTLVVKDDVYGFSGVNLPVVLTTDGAEFAESGIQRFEGITDQNGKIAFNLRNFEAAQAIDAIIQTPWGEQIVKSKIQIGYK